MGQYARKRISDGIASSDYDDDDDDEVPEPDFSHKYPNRKKCQEPEPPESPKKGGDIPEGLANDTMRYLIDKRWVEVYNNQDLLKDRTHRMDHSDIFYTTRTMLYRKGYDVSSLDEGEKRQKMYSFIKNYCEDTLGIKRHQIGIFAAYRAVMAFEGKTYSVSYENCKELAENGVDVICIEKEGIVEKLATFTDGVGIALVQSQGFASEYGIKLTKHAKKTGANVMVLTDFDADGIKIAFELEGVTRLGIDFESIDQINEHLQAEFDGEDPFKPEVSALPASVDDAIYKPDMKNLEPKLDKLLDINELKEGRKEAGTWKNLKKLTECKKRKSAFRSAYVDIEETDHELEYIDYLNTEYDEEGNTYLDFLQTNRIELNTIMTQIGPKRFWNWLYSQIMEQFPTRDYTRAIYVPPYKITLSVMDKLNDRVQDLIDGAIEDEKNTILDELGEVNGLLNTQTKKMQIDERLNNIVDEDEDVQDFTEKLEELIEDLDNGKDEE